MSNKHSGKLPLCEKILAAGYIAAMATYMVSESIFTMSILSVTLLALVSLFLEAWKLVERCPVEIEMRGGTEPFTGEVMKSTASGSRVGLLEVLCYLTAIVVVGSAVGGWNFNLLIALVILVVLYAVFRDFRALSRSETRHEQTQSSETMIPLQRSSRSGRPVHSPHRISSQLGEVKKSQDSAGWAHAPQQTVQKGTTHESIGQHKA